MLSAIQNAGLAEPWFFVVLFLAASFLMVWRLEAMASRGLEGTVLGTLVMPYCSGLGNLVFAYIMATRGGSGGEVMVNCLVNNVTNLTLLIGLPAVIWGMAVLPQKSGKTGKKKKGSDHAPRLNRLSLLLTLFALLFFTGATWALARDGKLDFADGLVLVGIFLFWQCIHVFEVLKNNVRQNKSLGAMIVLDLALLAVGAYAVFVSTDWLVEWISKSKTGWFSVKHLGWITGFLMVLPNALLALYYGWRKQPEVIYSSQAGDGHICIPLCIGLFALLKPISIPNFFETGVFILAGSAVLHIFFVTFFGQLPRFMGLLLIGAYGYFLYTGLIQ
ncbi:MAG: sodium:calcium symporter [Limisphaerales bacterium]